jgi:cytochrome c-type biogenesis protein CcmF
VLAGVIVFFVALLIGPADPFVTLSPVPGDGSGLNPLLQSPGMVIHPPLLYTGFVGFSIPFAFGMAALLARRVDGWWFAQTRRWTLFAWGALSIGIVLGGAWAYTELGWGGYWAWDPVENASFLPWLTATAYLHSVVIQEKRRMFKAWNLSLILMTYVLAIFGTFLTRSGILSSIHTFTEGPIGKWFLPFLALMLIGGVALLVTRAQNLRAENRLDSMLSRESAFLANNVLFLAACFAVLWGTIYPIVAEAISGTRVAVGPPFFNSVFIPISLALLALTGIGPLISWRKMSPRALGRVSRIPVAMAALVVLILTVLRVGNLGVVIALGLASFTAAAIVGEFARGSRLHRRREGLGWGAALTRTIARNRRRYGGYIVHLGVVLIVIGFAGSAFRTERAQHLERGQDMRVGAYTLAYERLENVDSAEKETYRAWIRVERGGDPIGRIYPERNLHLAQNQWQSEVAIRTNPVEDLYVVVTALDPDGAASVRAFVNPLTWWIWMGAAVMLGGIVILFIGGTPRPAPARAPARVTEPAVATR